MARMQRRSRLVWVGLCALLASGCGASSPAVEAMWAMPGEIQPGAQPTHAKASSGYLFSQGQPLRRNADVGTESTRGDLPETAYGAVGDDVWRTDERKAVAEARELQVGMVIDFWAEWCDACWRFDRETFADPQVRGLLSARFVPLRIDVTEETFRSREQLQRYSVTSVPTVLLLDAHGREVARIDSFMDSHAFLARLEAVRE